MGHVARRDIGDLGHRRRMNHRYDVDPGVVAMEIRVGDEGELPVRSNVIVVGNSSTWARPRSESPAASIFHSEPTACRARR